MRYADVWALAALAALAGCGDTTCPIPNPPTNTDLTTHRVPSEYATIQEAMDAAVDGDTVLAGC